MTIKEIMTSNKPYISKYGKMDESLKTKAKNLLWEFNNSDQMIIKDVVRFYKNY